jgi:DNA (cytosine-5)-methyltransferase 1
VTLRVMDLFSGIGGFSLGLKRAGGFRTVAYCEIDPFCQEVLQARMLDGSLDSAPICTDVRSLDGVLWSGCVDVICGGFPCQDISLAGKGAGLDGERSGLWREIARLVRQVRPRYVLVENVSALLGRGLGRVLGDLASSGYDAEWDVIPACAVGANHIRERVWILAYPNGEGEPQPQGGQQEQRGRTGDSRKEVAYPKVFGRSWTGDAWARRDGPTDCGWWTSEPNVGRVVDGFPGRVDRIAALGNAVVPQVVEWIGRRIGA